jgi:hypothetical protein
VARVQYVDGTPCRSACVEMYWGQVSNSSSGPEVVKYRREFTDSDGEVLIENLEVGTWAIGVPSWKDWKDGERKVIRIRPREPDHILLPVEHEPGARWVRVDCTLPAGLDPDDLELHDELVDRWGRVLINGDQTIYLPLYEDEDSLLLRMRRGSDGKLLRELRLFPTEREVPITLEWK